MKNYSHRCNWCQKDFAAKDKLSLHLAVCKVAKAVHNAEAYAGRPLSVDEVKSVRERARKEVAMEEEREKYQ